MTAGILAWVVLSLGASPTAGLKKPLTPRAAVTMPAESSQTRCDACHSAEGWSTARFPHDQTGFPLEGSHARVSCKKCHASDFKAPLPRTCASCHRDGHGGEFGDRCEGCHKSDTWESEFNADAHRRTNFPLVGRHAALPCQQCHLDQRGPNFRLSTVECVGCHRADYDRTAMTSVDHAAAGFSANCRECHEVWTFNSARFPSHDTCFPLSGTVHASISCLSCHTSLAGARASGTCATHTAACTTCHTHSCDRSDAEHRSVPGYQCKDSKCYECHRLPAKR